MRELRPRLETDRSWLEWVEIAVLAVLLVGLAVLFAVGLFAVRQADVTQCAKQVPSSSSTGVMLAVIALAGFAVGRAVAGARKWVHQAPPGTDQNVVRTNAFFQGLLALFLLVVALLLGYETYAVAHFAEAPPITEYVRCTAATNPWLAGLGTAAISILLGNWIWYPTR
jgi:hypothetical protein